MMVVLGQTITATIVLGKLNIHYYLFLVYIEADRDSHRLEIFRKEYLNMTGQKEEVLH